MRISDWSSDVCSSDLGATELDQRFGPRLDRQTRTTERLERKVDALTEMLGLFIRHQLTLVADQPPFDSDTARLGRTSYVSFMRLLAQRLMRTDSGEPKTLVTGEEIGRASCRDRVCR